MYYTIFLIMMPFPERITESVTLFVSLPRVWYIVGSIPFRVKAKIYPLNAQPVVIWGKTGWSVISIMCPGESTCLPVKY